MPTVTQANQETRKGVWPAILPGNNEHGWTDVPPVKWAANWNARIPYENDPRRSLKWRGRFAGIANAVNCYLPTEDVLGSAPAFGAVGVWSAQELLTGTGTMYLLPARPARVRLISWPVDQLVTRTAKTRS